MEGIGLLTIIENGIKKAKGKGEKYTLRQSNEGPSLQEDFDRYSKLEDKSGIRVLSDHSKETYKRLEVPTITFDDGFTDSDLERMKEYAKESNNGTDEFTLEDLKAMEADFPTRFTQDFLTSIISLSGGEPISKKYLEDLQVSFDKKETGLRLHGVSPQPFSNRPRRIMLGFLRGNKLRPRLDYIGIDVLEGKTEGRQRDIKSFRSQLSREGINLQYVKGSKQVKDVINALVENFDDISSDGRALSQADIKRLTQYDGNPKQLTVDDITKKVIESISQ